MSSRVAPIPSVTRLHERRPRCTWGTVWAVVICRRQSLRDLSWYSGVTDNIALGISQPGVYKHSIPLVSIFF